MLLWPAWSSIGCFLVSTDIRNNSSFRAMEGFLEADIADKLHSL